MDPLVSVLKKLRLRLGFQLWIECFVTTLLFAGAYCCAVIVVARSFGLAWLETWWMAAGPLAIGLLVSLMLLMRRWPRLLDAALQADNRLRLRERVTSSLQLSGVEGPMVEALHQDARAHIAGLDLPRHFPFEIPRRLRWLALVVIAWNIGYLFLPELDLFGIQARQVAAKAQEKARRIKAERIEMVARPLREGNEPPGTDSVAGTAAQIERLASQVASGELSEKQATAKLSALAEQLEKRREALQPESARDKLAQNLPKLGTAQDLAKSLLNGNFGEAAQKAQELKNKLDKMTPEEKKALAESLKKLADLSKGQAEGTPNPQLTQALSNAAAALQNASLDAQTPGLTLQDVASILEQLEKLNLAMKELQKCEFEMLGPSDFCRICGARLKKCTGGPGCRKCGPGYSCYGLCGNCGGGWCMCQGNGHWRAGDATKFGYGMGGPGHGRGGTTGKLPDIDDSFQPTMLPGDLTKGPFLADIVQRAQPDAGQQPTAEFVSGVVAEAKQEAEQALTKEEIPPGAREFVRQYFSTIENSEETGQKQK